jgi:antitoxin ParD1/3/4
MDSIWILCGREGCLMTMHINLSPEMESYIKTKVSTGFYGSATEVIRDAIRRMQANENQLAAFRAAVAKGDAQLDRGEGIAYTDELLNTMTQTALQDMHSDKSIDPDVLP